MALLNFLKGKRTYICAVILFILGGCRALNWIDQSAYETLSVMVSGLGLAALRAAVPPQN